MRLRLDRWLVALAAIVVASVAFGFWYDHAAGQWDARVESALGEARAADIRSELYLEQAIDASARAEALAEEAGERVQVVTERVVEIREVMVPDTCIPLVAPRDSVIDTLFVAVDEWKEAYETEVSGAALLRLGLQEQTTRGDSLVAVLQDRPGPRKWWVPGVGVGAFTGFCSGETCSGVGVTLSWRIR